MFTFHCQQRSGRHLLKYLVDATLRPHVSLYVAFILNTPIFLQIQRKSHAKEDERKSNLKGGRNGGWASRRNDIMAYGCRC